VGQPVVYEPIGYQSLGYRVKKALLGRPLPTSRLVHERLRKLVALAVFSSDAISSTAYGTEQIMLILVTAGAVATGLALPVALGIGGLLAILILSYRQTITAYPSAGGAYIVTRDNFGPGLAQVAGSALLIDYVLTVAVSVTSGVAALTTAFPPLQRFILPLSLLAIVLIAWANLAGVRESGRIFAVPTYLFVGSCALMLLVGVVRQLTGHLPQMPDGQTAPLPPQTATVGLLLVLHAFASGCTALTGVEAISNGIPAFRRPEAQNARRTLIAMGAILGTLFIGVSYLAVHTHVRPYHGHRGPRRGDGYRADRQPRPGTCPTSGRHDEAVADAGLGDQQLGHGWVVELAAEAGHMVPQRSALLLGPGSPEALRQKVAGAEPAPAGGQDLEESVLGAGQLHRLPPPGDQAGVKVDADRADLDAPLPVGALGPAMLQRPADPGQQVGHGERLGDVVVGAEFQRRGPVALVVDGGEDHDRRRRPATEPGEHLEAADVGQAQVEHDAVRLPGLDHRQSGRTRGGGQRLVAACAQVGRDHPQDRGLVVDYQDSVTHDLRIGSSR
jgi:Amino acid permease